MKKILFLPLLLLSLFSVSLSINVDYINASNKKTYTTYLDKKLNSPSKAVLSPTLVCYGKDVSLLSDSKIKNSFYDVIIDVDDNLDVAINNGKVNLTNYLDSYIKGKYVPVIRLADSNVDSFIDYFENEYTYFDMMVISSSLNVLGKIYKNETTHILGSVYDISNIVLPKATFENWEFVKNANLVGANILLVNGEDPNLATSANYIASMSKVCWGTSNSEVSDINVPTSYCYGLVSDSPLRSYNSLEKLNKKGRLSPQFISAHRGITTYANENSLSSCLFASSEGASHIEIDLQICADKEIVLCHNSQTNYNSDKSGWYFTNITYDRLVGATLNDYSTTYKETYSRLSDLIENIIYTDVIVIAELKFDGASTKAVDELKCIENLKRIVDKYPEFEGHWFAITFYAPLAEKMNELMPEIPLGYLGGAQSGYEKDHSLSPWSRGGGHKGMKDYSNKIKFLKTYNITLDENFSAVDPSNNYYCEITADFYLARGYVQNTWTYEDIRHLNFKTSIATTNKAEDCAYLIKEFDVNEISLTQSEYNSGKVKVNTLTYNGWKNEVECGIVPILEKGNECYASLFYKEIDLEYALYSNIIKITIV